MLKGTLIECPRCGIRYVKESPALVVKHTTCTPESAKREGDALWASIASDFAKRGQGPNR